MPAIHSRGVDRPEMSIKTFLSHASAVTVRIMSAFSSALLHSIRKRDWSGTAAGEHQSDEDPACGRECSPQTAVSCLPASAKKRDVHTPNGAPAEVPLQVFVLRSHAAEQIFRVRRCAPDLALATASQLRVTPMHRLQHTRCAQEARATARERGLWTGAPGSARGGQREAYEDALARRRKPPRPLQARGPQPHPTPGGYHSGAGERPCTPPAQAARRECDQDEVCAQRHWNGGAFSWRVFPPSPLLSSSLPHILLCTSDGPQLLVSYW